MTREEAKRRMEICRDFLANNYSDMGEPNFTAFNMAIKALSQEPCDDAISREAVNTLYDKWRPRLATHVSEFGDELKALPSVMQKSGKWLEKDGYDGDTYYDCSVCGESWSTIEGTPWDNGMKYCPNCGARMIEPQESEDKE